MVDLVNGTYKNGSQNLKQIFSSMLPVGSIIAWPKNFPEVPPLPLSWVECNGQIIENQDSVFDGISIPDLNGENRFLRGNTESGGIGGEETHELTEDEIPSHNHQYRLYSYLSSRGPGSRDSLRYTTTEQTDAQGNDDGHENQPPYYDIVWIIRIL